MVKEKLQEEVCFDLEENDRFKYMNEASLLIRKGDGQGREEREKSYEEALEYFDKVIESQIEEGEVFKFGSQHIGPYIKKSELLEKMGRYEEALECFEKLDLEETRDVYLYVAKARLTGRMGDLESAFEQFDYIIKKCPLFADAYLEKADLYFEAGQNDEAMKCYESWEAVEAGKFD